MRQADFAAAAHWSLAMAPPLGQTERCPATKPGGSKVLGRPDALQFKKVAGASITPPAAAGRPSVRPRHSQRSLVWGMINGDAGRIGPLRVFVRRLTGSCR